MKLNLPKKKKKRNLSYSANIKHFWIKKKKRRNMPYGCINLRIILERVHTCCTRKHGVFKGENFL